MSISYQKQSKFHIPELGFGGGGGVGAAHGMAAFFFHELRFPDGFPPLSLSLLLLLLLELDVSDRNSSLMKASLRPYVGRPDPGTLIPTRLAVRFIRL